MTMRRMLVVLGATLLLLVPGVAQADAPHGRLIESRADSLVAIKVVLNIQVSAHGQSQDFEQSLDTQGVIVNGNGLIMLPSGAISPNFNRPNMEVNSTPTSIRVIFPGDTKEYDAVLGATDSRLGLSFIRVKDLEGKEIRAVDMERTKEPVLGDTVYGVGRLGQGFDHAPYCEASQVVAWITKPRKMWVVQGEFTQVAHPLYTADDELVGFIVNQEGVGGEGAVPGVLPLKVILSLIERAGEETARVLEEALEREAEEGAAASEDGEGETTSPEGEGDDGPSDEGEDDEASPEEGDAPDEG